VQLAYCRIVSPIDGRVGLRQVDPGNIVHAADATGIVVITQLQPIAVVFTIPEDSSAGRPWCRPRPFSAAPGAPSWT
jgi:membrane fusion protein, multidrug efflux system